MKILVLAESLNGNSAGWATAARNGVRGSEQRGHEVRALVHTADDSMSCMQIAELPRPLSMLGNPIAVIQTIRAVNRIVTSWKPDIIHVMVEPYALALPYTSVRNRGIPWVMSLLGTYTIAPLGDWKTRRPLLRAYREMNQVLACSTYTLGRVIDELRKHDEALGRLVEAKTSMFHLGIEPPPSLPTRKTSNVKHIVFVGGVKPRKGVKEIIRGCARFREAGIPFRLDVIGDCPKNSYTDSVRDEIRVMGLDDVVHLRGHVSASELEDAYANADLFMMLSRSHGMHFEGFGLVFLEAGARGIPVIGPMNSGCVEAIDEGKSGYVVDADNADMVAERMRWILEKRKISPDACKSWALRHSIARQAEETEKGYERAISGI